MTQEETSPTPGSDDNTVASQNIAGEVYKVLTSLRFAVVIGLFLTIACVLGTLLPQGGNIEGFAQANPKAETLVRFLETTSLTDVYSAWWFLALILLFGLSLTACTGKRIATLIKKRGRAGGHIWGSALTHISLILIMTGAIVRGVWGEKGILEFREGEIRNEYILDGKPRKLPFSIQLVDFQLERYKPENEEPTEVMLQERLLLHFRDGHGHAIQLPAEIGTEHIIKHPHEDEEHPSYLVRLVRMEPDFVIDMGTGDVTSRSNEPRNPAMLVHILSEDLVHTNEQWLFAKYPSTHVTQSEWAKQLPFHLAYETNLIEPEISPVKDFKSTLRILQGEETVMEKTIEVNAPLSYGGYTFFQSGFNPNDLTYTGLQVVKDPGVPIVYTGFILMIIGLTIVFYLAPMKRTAGRRRDPEEP